MASATVAVISPKGGVGKTTISFVLGNLLAEQLRLRVVALDANPDFGTLSALAPDEQRSTRSLADLLADSTQIDSPAELNPYVARLPTGLHLLGAPAHAEVMAQMTPGLYSRLLDFLERFYEVVILDLGTGITDPLAQFAVDRADQNLHGAPLEPPRPDRGPSGLWGMRDGPRFRLSPSGGVTCRSWWA